MLDTRAAHAAVISNTCCSAAAQMKLLLCMLPTALQLQATPGCCKQSCSMPCMHKNRTPAARMPDCLQASNAPGSAKHLDVRTYSSICCVTCNPLLLSIHPTSNFHLLLVHAESCRDATSWCVASLAAVSGTAAAAGHSAAPGCAAAAVPAAAPAAAAAAASLPLQLLLARVCPVC